MSYVVAAYAVAIGPVVLYALHLHRTRARLRQALGAPVGRGHTPNKPLGDMVN